MGALQDVYDIGQDLLSGARGWKERADRERFNQHKGQLRLHLETEQRTRNVNRLGFMPTPEQVPLAEALVHDGFLDRDIHTGRYFVKTGYADYMETAFSLY